ncbi:SH3 domain-containing protein [Stigmatella hybrida]|uniref:SH3 domain-containing protein n=1 Tax=Stigmatella hybrida TaxID=394097 RepID=UPI001CDAA22A|nr:SH3 domain-containing protein [Stigmatella hybrida]
MSDQKLRFGSPSSGTSGSDPGVKRFSRKEQVRKLGIAYKPEGINLREKPSPNARVVKHLAFNTRVFVDSIDDGWYFVTTDGGVFGYCVATHLDMDLPEPQAKIHWIKHGESALLLSHRYYGGQAKWGSDHRFYVNGLVYSNQGEGRRGIYKPDPRDDWDTTQVLEGTMIWIPSLAFLKSLRGKAGSESISYEAWEAAKTIAQSAVDFTLGASAFTAGVIHGVLESLWDVLVGFKDLAVMIWDILASLLTGNLLADAFRLWSDLSKLDWNALVQGWLDRFSAKWNAPELLRRWHFRGWVIGYVIMEALMLFFSGGVVQGIKWVGKASKITKLITSLPRVKKLVEAVKASTSFQKATVLLGKGAAIAETAADAEKWIGQLLFKPKSLWGKSPDQIADVFRKAGYKADIAPSTKGSKLSKQIQIKRFDIQNIQVHPGGGRHGGSYYKISSSSKGTIKVVDRATYVPTLGEKATIIYMDTGLQGWMLQAATANAAAQNVLQEVDDARKPGGE